MEVNVPKFLFLIVNLVQLFLIVNSSEYKIIETTKGFVRGMKLVTHFENKPYYAFKGIPYAKSPLQHLRYRPPVSLPPWNGVRNAFNFGNSCIQIPQIFKFDLSSPYMIGDEDCLFINVYTPDVIGNYPVMFWIHGGGFGEGTSSFYGPDFIINNDVILVTFNYRLGAFGFLSLGTRQYSGNMGLKDQVLALKWVNENIENFGGDKNRITVCGQDAGGASANFLTVSQTSQYLFQRSIAMSGSILNLWFASEKKNHVVDMYKLAKRSDPSVSTIDDVLKFLKNVNATYLTDKTVFNLSNFLDQPRQLIPYFPFTPVVETPYDDNYFLIETGEKLIRNKNFPSPVDSMFGYVNKEVYQFLGTTINNPSSLQSFNGKFEVQLPLNYDNDINYNTKRYRRIARKIHDSYFGIGVLVDANTALDYINMMSDIWIRYPVTLSAKIQASVSCCKTFFYEFSVDDTLNIFKALGNVTLPGASHGDELCYLFKCAVPNLYDNISPKSVAGKAIRNISKLWTNFVKYGDPTIREEIKPIDKTNMHFFNITNHGINIGNDPSADAMALWDKIYSEHYKGFLKTNVLNG